MTAGEEFSPWRCVAGHAITRARKILSRSHNVRLISLSQDRLQPADQHGQSKPRNQREFQERGIKRLCKTFLLNSVGFRRAKASRDCPAEPASH